MFTGLIECTGSVRGLRRLSSGSRLDLAVTWPDSDTPRGGDSIAVNGVCLTVAETTAHGFAADVSPETLSRTLLGELRIGEPTNMERALKVGDRLGGHLVQGHVDGVVRLLHIAPEGGFARWRLSLPPELRAEVVNKGSVCLHGVSLTVACLSDDSFEVALIPETLEATILHGMRPGSRIHLETDVLAKYVAGRLGHKKTSAIHEIFGNGSYDA